MFDEEKQQTNREGRTNLEKERKGILLEERENNQQGPAQLVGQQIVGFLKHVVKDLIPSNVYGEDFTSDLYTSKGINL